MRSLAIYRFSLMLGCLLGGCATVSGPLATLPMMSPEASQQNLKGIQAYNDGKWEAAKQEFETAIQADPNLPEAHFNLALTLHKLELHGQATDHFRQAGELASSNKEIVESSIYKNHLGLSSTLERHLSGGYRY